MATTPTRAFGRDVTNCGGSDDGDSRWGSRGSPPATQGKTPVKSPSATNSMSPGIGYASAPVSLEDVPRLLSPMSGLRVRIKKLRIELETAKLQAETEHKVASEKRAMLASMEAENLELRQLLLLSEDICAKEASEKDTYAARVSDLCKQLTEETETRKGTAGYVAVEQAVHGQAPTPLEIVRHAETLGMEPGADNRFLWIAEQALESLRTEGWREVKGGWGAMLHNPSCEGSAPQVPCRHPQDTYRQLYKDIKAKQWDLPTKSEVEDMATYLGLDLEQDAALMWLAQQAVIAPLPAGWTELEDEHGPYFVHADAGLSTRWHPLDSVFQTAAAKEAEKLRKENFSVARAAVLGEGVGHPRLQMRLLEEDGKGTYTYDWLTRRRVQ